MLIFPQHLTDKILNSSSFTNNNNAVIVNLGDGKSQRAGIGSDPFHESWNCAWNLRKTDYDMFIDFYNQHGLVRAFQWTTPLMDTGTYIFDSAPVIRFDGVLSYNISATLKEVKESLI